MGSSWVTAFQPSPVDPRLVFRGGESVWNWAVEGACLGIVGKHGKRDPVEEGIMKSVHEVVVGRYATNVDWGGETIPWG